MIRRAALLLDRHSFPLCVSPLFHLSCRDAKDGLHVGFVEGFLAVSLKIVEDYSMGPPKMRRLPRRGYPACWPWVAASLRSLAQRGKKTPKHNPHALYRILSLGAHWRFCAGVRRLRFGLSGTCSTELRGSRVQVWIGWRLGSLFAEDVISFVHFQAPYASYSEF